jgi:hypothetical protein
MPIEIRELIIKTEISSSGYNKTAYAKDKQLEKLRKQLLEECKKLVSPAAKRTTHKR